MADYVNSEVPIYKYKEGLASVRDSVFDREHQESEFRQIDNSIISDAEMVALASAILLLPSYSTRGYEDMINTLSTSHIRNYKNNVFFRRAVYNRINKADARLAWAEEVSIIKSLLATDIAVNALYHITNANDIRENAVARLSIWAVRAYLVERKLEKLVNVINSRKFRNKAIINATNSIIPDENIRLYELIRKGKILTYDDVFKNGIQRRQKLDIEDKWTYHQWVAYSRSDYPCYGTDGQIVKIGQKFKNGFYGGKVHPGCLCNQIPIFR
jgi:hypothetical protein